MLATARQRLPQITFERGDIADWAPGGMLAVQMPDNLEEPSHRLMRETAAALLGTPADDAAAIVQWLRATGLKPYLDPLTPELQAQFLAEYQRRIELAYPERADGTRLLTFPRSFIVARRGNG